ncbi:MAG: hypothetical protein SF339_16770 [Blastocatellia bacterium]|nr:hypothetical protein [Blastocatellia bacterium]
MISTGAPRAGKMIYFAPDEGIQVQIEAIGEGRRRFRDVASIALRTLQRGHSGTTRRLADESGFDRQERTIGPAA